MKFLLFLPASLLLPAGAFTLVAADAIAEPPMSTWMEGGAFGVVCLLLVVFVWKVGPYLHKQNIDAEQAREEASEKRDQAFRETLEKQQATFVTCLDTICERQEREARDDREVMIRLAENIQHLSVNCAKVHATKPSEP